MNNKEFRYVNIRLANQDEQSRRIEGVAAVFESWSEDLGFREIIKKGAITEDVIKNSDIIMNYNHNDENLLARSRFGEGTLEVTLEDDGLHIAFEAPKTQLGDDMLYHLRAGNLNAMSFAFTISPDDDAQRWYEDNGVLYREILKIDRLYDTAIVNNPAYEDTSVFARSIDLANEARKNIQKRNMNEQEYLDKIAELEAKIAELETKEEPTDEPKEEPVDEPKEEKEEPVDEPKEEPTDEPKEEPTDEPKEEPVDEPEKKEEIDPEKEEENKNINRNIMNLQKQFRKAYNGAPVEFRAVDTISTSGNTVATEVENILAPIYADSLIGKLGMKVYSGLTDQKKFPILGKPVAGWMGEQGTTQAGTVGVGAKYLEPHILKVMIPVSHTLLVEDNVNFEATLKDTMVNALKDKLESTLFSAIAANDNGADNPAGILNGLTTQGTIASFTDIANLEAVLEGHNYGNLKYAVAPNAKATLRTMIKGTNGTGMVMENGEIDGTPAYSSSCVATGNVICGDFSQVAVGIWDTVRVEMVNDSTLAGSDQVMFVVTMYADFEAVRTDAIEFATV